MNRAGNLAKGVAVITSDALPARGWANHAACIGADPNLWFIEDRDGSYGEARSICADCLVRRECLAWAIETKTDHGLWGGLAPYERKRLRHRQLELTDDHQRFDEIRPKATFL